MQVTADISKILKSVKASLNFIFDVFSESRIVFFSFLVFLAVENVVSFTVTHSYHKRGSVTVPNYVKTFHANIGHNLTKKF